MAVHLKAADSRRVPWKNGLGTTLEIATDTRAGEAWTWRLSIADVPTSGSFSRFEGCDRFIACIEGAGMRLETRGTTLDVPNAGEALRFSGDDATEGLLVGGPCRDVNLIVHRSRWSARLAVLRGEIAHECDAVTTFLLHVVEGKASVSESQGIGHDLVAGDSLIVHATATTTRARGVVVAAALRSVPSAVRPPEVAD